MSVLEAIILGLTQGFTEFLPVSSSGHLVLLQKAFRIEGDLLFFDTMLHLATLIAVVCVLYKEVLAILKRPFGKTTWLLVIATLPIVILTVLIKDFVEESFEGAFLGWGFLITGLLLTVSELIYANRKARKAEAGYSDALGMGLMQAVAVFPGISRSGSALAGALAFGMEREKGAKFSFLMSIPVILGSVALQGYEMLSGSAGEIYILPTVVGMIFAGVSGYFAASLMLRLVKNRRLYGFALYTAVLGALILLDQLAFHLIF